MFGCGAVLWSIWRTRNDKVFNGKMLADPSNAVFLCCFWLDTWAILQKKNEKRIVELGSLRIRKTANDVFCRAFGWSPVDRRITGALLPWKSFVFCWSFSSSALLVLFFNSGTCSASRCVKTMMLAVCGCRSVALCRGLNVWPFLESL